VFQEVPKESFYVGGNPADDFVRIWVDHIARSFKDEETKERFLNACNRLLAPFIPDRGLQWEMHADETPFQSLVDPGPEAAPSRLSGRETLDRGEPRYPLRGAGSAAGVVEARRAAELAGTRRTRRP
jgi:Putative oxalocrotonate tautomerase enzyme